MKKFTYLLVLLIGVLALSACVESTTPTSQPIPNNPTAQPEITVPPTDANESATPTQSVEVDQSVAPTSEPAPTQPPAIDEPPKTTFPFIFGVIGDFGDDGQPEADVAALVKSWDPEIIITTGDNNNPIGSPETIDQNIGKYYAEYIYPYKGSYGEGAQVNRFFPTLGNHDADTDDGQPYLDYFELPNNERYYDFTWGPVHFFALNSDWREPDGVGMSSVQAQWLQGRMAASTSPWNVVYFHASPYASGLHGSTDWMQWPFADWGADVVLSGHEQIYERLEVDGIPYIVNGVGGGALYAIGEIVPQSIIQHAGEWGAVRGQATETELTFEFITRDGRLIDTISLTQAPSEQAQEPASAAAPDAVSFPNPAGYTWQNIAAGLDKPVEIISAGDGSGRLFILEQAGVIRIFQNGQVLSQPFLDINDRVVDLKGYDERGLLGLAFDPGYAENGLFYVYYSANNSDSVVSSFRVSADHNQADPGSERILLTQPQPYGNHNGGHIEFGPDGHLYIGLGDGGSANDPEANAQNLNTLLGSLLRIDVSRDGYTVPGDNPFISQNARPEIWAYGLRNPWKFHFDTQTGELYIADVGQGDWEEVDYVSSDLPAGLNFGWDYYEGTHPFEGSPPSSTPLIDPAVEYNHGQGCSITGGVVYRGPLTEWTGVYFYSDFCSGTVWGLLQDGNGAWISQALFTTGLTVTSFGYDEVGNVYLVDHSGGLYMLTSQ